mmetsp:Transcript_90349/g.264338  ORF Transcript_90349/g.264338 Transcript_90349/m.264338 type:complete len:103 (-) Transcript_90349:88-396(-)
MPGRSGQAPALANDVLDAGSGKLALLWHVAADRGMLPTSALQVYSLSSDVSHVLATGAWCASRDDQREWLISKGFPHRFELQEMPPSPCGGISSAIVSHALT